MPPSTQTLIAQNSPHDSLHHPTHPLNMLHGHTRINRQRQGFSADVLAHRQAARFVAQVFVYVLQVQALGGSTGSTRSGCLSVPGAGRRALRCVGCKDCTHGRQG